VCGVPVAQIEQLLARDYGQCSQQQPAAIRLNYGMQRRSSGGNAARAVARLPAPDWRLAAPAGGVPLSPHTSSSAALQRLDLLVRPTPPHAEHDTIGDLLTPCLMLWPANRSFDRL
jgi:anaerobic selenocysteine-containing dehydrogenase